MDIQKHYMNGDEWITFTIFAPEKNWNYIVCTMIARLFQSNYNLNNVKSYFVGFCFEKEYSIRCALKTNKMNFQQIIAELNHQLKERYPKFFNSTVFISLMNFQLPKSALYHDSEEFFNPRLFTDFIIYYFKKKLINEISVFNLGYTIHLIWINNRMITSNENTAEVIEKGYSFFWMKFINQEIVANQLNEFYIINKHLLIELYEDIKFGKCQQCTWYKKLRKICHDTIIDNIHRYSLRPYDLEQTYYLIPRLVNEHLGISADLRNVQTYVINRAITPKMMDHPTAIS